MTGQWLLFSQHLQRTIFCHINSCKSRKITFNIELWSNSTKYVLERKKKSMQIKACPWCWRFVDEIPLWADDDSGTCGMIKCNNFLRRELAWKWGSLLVQWVEIFSEVEFLSLLCYMFFFPHISYYLSGKCCCSGTLFKRRL